MVAKLRILDLFRDACIVNKLDFVWSQKSILAFLLYIDSMHYTYSTIHGHWKVITMLAKETKQLIPKEAITMYDYIVANCKVIKDNKLPVTKPLLESLCWAADIALAGYDCVLAKCLFQATWGGFLCCCEYTQPRRGRPNHNLHHDSISITPSGLGISFWSDKVSRNDPTVKHHMVYWPFLLEGTKHLFTKYDRMCPKEAHYYFVREDGQQVTHEAFLDFLDVCLMQTRFHSLVILPHRFRVGTASWACHEGQHILQVRSDGRWWERSKAIEPYLHLMFMEMEPKDIYEKHERFRWHWCLSPCHLSHITRCVVQAPGGALHLFQLNFVRNFP